MIKTSKYYDVAVWIIIGMSVSLTCYGSWCGVGLTYDSHDYLAAATSLTRDCVFLNADGGLYFFHAPLYPVLIALYGADPVLKIKIFNILLSIVTLITLHLAIRQMFKSSWIYLVGIYTIGLAVGYQMIHHFAWTEPVFLFLFVLHNLCLVRFLKSHKRRDFILLIGLAFLIGITRNAGIFILASTGVVLFIYGKNRSVKGTITYLSIGSLGFVAWNIYAFYIQKGLEPIYNDPAFFGGGWQNLINYIDVVSRWFLPAIIPFILRFLILLILIIWFVGNKMITSISVGAKVFLIQFFIYILIMVFFIDVDMDEIERLLAIVYPWLIIGSLLVLDQNWEAITSGLKRVLQVGAMVWLIYIGVRSVKNSIDWHQNRCQEILTMKMEKDTD